jgi:hypothetical protein
LKSDKARSWLLTGAIERARFFECQKQPAGGSRGMVVSNHPLASAAGAEMLAAGGNAIDAAIATLFTLTVVEPMLVGIIGAAWRISGSQTVASASSTARAPFRSRFGQTPIARSRVRRMTCSTPSTMTRDQACLTRFCGKALSA